MANCGKCLEYFIGPLTRQRIPKPQYWLLTNWRQFPPGGWSVFGDSPITSPTIEGLVDGVMHKRELSFDDAKDLIHSELRKRGVVINSSPEKKMPVASALPMSDLGPALWSALAVSIWRWGSFLSALELCESLMSKDSPVSCEECRDSDAYRAISSQLQRVRAGETISSASSRARFVHDIHNMANKKLNKPLMSYRDSSSKWGWPDLDSD